MIEAGKYYISNDGGIYGPAGNYDAQDDAWILQEIGIGGSNWGFYTDGRFCGQGPDFRRSLVRECGAPGSTNTAHTSNQSVADKPIHEMELDDYRRGIDAIWDQRHNIGI